ncbi:type VI secretion system contractile sheath small subunit [Blastopirellula sp. JC732]|uniref:Type VI secretion system contractile sheath small subunit n=1 Tax=Blastopirellula sediminis TaxID=2894196 RepID=A0A9X1MMI6_9BACT|nr:type VI secretion system contractile sheath small subunit [Blastopirellula sediminis]MCC9607166.1 type VI secretion system contractile sheath small subunit [Blastopirellula sediminis]MCC9629541.1 type VI secretion system contractile sheath small subunit [Blastopirellula sediminis]
MSESLQHKLDRVRPPRVQITYDVETGGAMEVKELPLVVGVMADLSGQPKEALPGIKQRKFVPIDRDNFNSVLEKSGARVAMQVPNVLEDDNTNLSVELNFKDMTDFEPTAVARQVPVLANLLEMRDRLKQLLSKMEGNDALCGLLDNTLSDDSARDEVSKDLGVEAPTA